MGGGGGGGGGLRYGIDCQKKSGFALKSKLSSKD